MLPTQPAQNARPVNLKHAVAEEEEAPSLLPGAAPVLREEFNLVRKWRISSDLK
jgi:hypothetical protein